VFERDGNRYVFARAQLAGDSTSLATVRAKTEKHSMAAKKKTLVVIVAG